MTATAQWGVYLLTPPDSDGIKLASQEMGSRRRMLDGSLAVDQIRTYVSVSFTWSYLTLAERNDLRVAYDTYSANPSSLILPDGQAWYQVLVTEPWNESQFYDYWGLPRYSVSFSVEDV